jgi:hypothetical protein
MEHVYKMSYEPETQYKHVPTNNIQITSRNMKYILHVQCDSQSEALIISYNIGSTVLLKTICGITYWRSADGKNFAFVSHVMTWREISLWAGGTAVIGGLGLWYLTS